MSGSSDISVLIVDDEAANLESLERIFAREGMRTFTAPSAPRAVELCRQHRVHVVLTDLMMPGMDGISLIKALATVAPDTEVVVMTAYGTVETAVKAMREGAYDFVEKPLKRVQIVKTVRKAAEHQALLSENRDLKRELTQLKHKSIVGSSPALRKALVDCHAGSALHRQRAGAGRERHRQGADRAPRARAAPSARASSWRSTWRRCPRASSRARSSATRRAHSPAPAASARGASPRPAAARCSSTRSASSRQHVQVKLLRVLQEGEYEPLGGRTERAELPADRGHQPRSRQGGQRGPLPRGSVLSPQRDRHHLPAAARSQRGHPAARRSLRRRLLPQERARHVACHAGSARPPLRAITGPATCASSRT